MEQPGSPPPVDEFHMLRSIRDELVILNRNLEGGHFHGRLYRKIIWAVFWAILGAAIIIAMATCAIEVIVGPAVNHFRLQPS